MTPAGLLGTLSDWYERNKDRIYGGGVRGAATRGLLGVEAPQEMTPTQRDVYENAIRISAPAQGLGATKAIFIGAKAKNWNKDAAKQFETLEKAGVSNKEAFLQTGTFRSPDGQLRQEISDRSAFFPGVGTPEGREYNILGQTLFHPEQRKSYPDLSSALTQTRLGRATGEYSDPVPGTATTFGREEQIFAQGANRDEIKKILLHEMQHAIQGREGFATGGAVQNYLGDVSKELAAIDRKQKALDRKIYKAGGVQTEADRREWLSLMDQRNALTPQGQYQRLAGEAEARAVEKRMGYTPQQRAAIFPLEDYDIPINQLILRGLLAP